VGLEEGTSPGMSSGGGGCHRRGTGAVAWEGGPVGRKTREGKATDRWGPAYCAVV
jgi:hypothetical protein